METSSCLTAKAQGLLQEGGNWPLRLRGAGVALGEPLLGFMQAERWISLTPGSLGKESGARKEIHLYLVSE